MKLKTNCLCPTIRTGLGYLYELPENVVALATNDTCETQWTLGNTVVAHYTPQGPVFIDPVKNVTNNSLISKYCEPFLTFLQDCLHTGFGNVTFISSNSTDSGRSAGDSPNFGIIIGCILALFIIVIIIIFGVFLMKRFLGRQRGKSRSSLMDELRTGEEKRTKTLNCLCRHGGAKQRDSL